LFIVYNRQNPTGYGTNPLYHTLNKGVSPNQFQRLVSTEPSAHAPS
jgi:hypothetical protein